MQEEGMKSAEVEAIIDAAVARLPEAQRRKPWAILDHGTKLLSSDLELDCYLAAYGKAHCLKAEHGISRFPWKKITGRFEVFDWGAGQGLAALCLVEELKRRGVMPSLKRVTLVEPSGMALARAVEYTRSLAGDEVEIVPLNRYLPAYGHIEGEIDRLDFREPIAIHLFSNILDIDSIDPKRLAHLVASGGGQHHVLCIGPANLREKRIEAFSNYFNLSQNDRWLTFKEPVFRTIGKWTFGCFLRGFSFQCNQPEPVVKRYSFYAPVQLFAGYRIDACCDLLSLGTRKDGTKYEDYEGVAFEVLAPFDLGGWVCEDVHPILAVLSNMVSRGMPTKASPWLEGKLAELVGLRVQDDDESDSLNYDALASVKSTRRQLLCLRWVPIAVARLQKVVLEALICGKLRLDAQCWNVAVKEGDVPCAALAFAELREMFNHLAALSADYKNSRFPEVELTVINRSFTDSPLHVGQCTVYREISPAVAALQYDLVVDIAIREYCDAKHVVFSEFQHVRNECYFNVRSSKEVYADRVFYTSSRIVYRPLARRNAQGGYDTIAETAGHLRYFLQLLFRKRDFRDGQLPILNRALQLQPVIGLLPTGGGKSLTYQLAALLQPGVTLVIDPLVSLMKDQEDGLKSNGIDACAVINSSQSGDEKKKNQIRMQESKALVVFLSPERLSIDYFRRSLRAMHSAGVYFAYGVIDEVHCVSEWGHDFRPSYLHLGRNLVEYVRPKKTGNKKKDQLTLFGLTATASFDVLADVERELSGDGAFPLTADSTVRYENTNRLELQYRVVSLRASSARKRKEIFEQKKALVAQVVLKLGEWLRELQTPEAIARIKERFEQRETITDEAYRRQIQERKLEVGIEDDWYKEDNDCQAGLIIFCPHRAGGLGVYDNEWDLGVASALERALQVEHRQFSRFIGGDAPKYQESFMESFIKGKTPVMVATKAFGMGIDKPNVRFTINMNHSGSLESFVQEAGRAGRDRKMALATILYSSAVIENDGAEGTPKRDEEGQNPDEKEERRRLQSVDFSVHQFFHDMGYPSEKCDREIMNFVLKHPVGRADDAEGFLERLYQAKEEEPVEVTLTYGYGSKDYNSVIEILSHFSRGENSRQTDKDSENRVSEHLGKAIYRLCCIGVVSDYTQDYGNKQYEIKATRKADGEYYRGLQRFLERYYTPERAAEEVGIARNYMGQNEVHRCLAYLTHFIYDKIAAKRYRAIQDMERFCQQAVDSKKSWLEVNEDLKDTLYYYFNSRYAREGYSINGHPYSLTDDTERGRNASFDILFKYMRVVDDDLLEVGSTQKDSIKHLHGAVRLILRAVTDANPALDLLNVFCLLYSGTGGNENLRDELVESYMQGYSEFYKRTPDKKEFYEKIAMFHNTLRGKTSVDEGDWNMLQKKRIEFEIKSQAEWLSTFTERFTSGLKIAKSTL